MSVSARNFTKEKEIASTLNTERRVITPSSFFWKKSQRLSIEGFKN